MQPFLGCGGDLPGWDMPFGKLRKPASRLRHEEYAGAALLPTTAGGAPVSWHRWGDDDERGALNLLDSAAVQRGLAAARQGEVVPLGLPVQARRVPVMPPRPPVLHTMLVDGADFEAGARRGPNGLQFADDHLAMACHSGTHLDALSHVARDGLMYNGVPASEVRSATGARRLGIEKVGGVVCRGVLLDLLKQSASLEAGRAITASDLQRALREVGTELHPGDAVLIRTGWLARF